MREKPIKRKRDQRDNKADTLINGKSLITVSTDTLTDMLILTFFSMLLSFLLYQKTEESILLVIKLDQFL